MAIEAEKMDHHPAGGTNVYNTVEVWVHIHMMGDIVTDKDHTLAAKIDKPDRTLICMIVMICAEENSSAFTKTNQPPAAHTILMIRPASFGYNTETAVNNYFQSLPAIPKEQPKTLALQSLIIW